MTSYSGNYLKRQMITTKLKSSLMSVMFSFVGFKGIVASEIKF